MTSSGENGLKIEQIQVPNRTGRSARRSKRPLLVSRFCCKCSMKTSWNLVIRYNSVIRSRSVSRSRFSEMSDQWKVSLYITLVNDSALAMSLLTWL